jgi:hypothetical protein
MIRLEILRLAGDDVPALPPLDLRNRPNDATHRPSITIINAVPTTRSGTRRGGETSVSVVGDSAMHDR